MNIVSFYCQVKEEYKKDEESESEIFGKVVKKYREQEGITQEQLAADVGCTSNYISEIENNKTNTTLNLAGKISSRLKIDFRNALKKLKPDDSND